MKRALIAAVLSLAFSAPVFAVEGGQPPNAQGATFEQRQSHILKIFDERIASLQEGRACTQAAKNDDDLKACRKKHRAEMREKRGGMGQQGGMMGGPQGQ